MLNNKLHLHNDTLAPDALDTAATRDGFGLGLVEAGENDDRVVAICADLAESTRMQAFQEKFPERYVEMGVAEQNLATVGSGMANYGKIPFIASYAAFSPGRNNEQIRTTIALNNVPVKIVGSHAGLSVGPDGATHQALEDIGLMRMQPNMTVIAPIDSEQARKATIVAAQYDGPVYLRLARAGSPVFTTKETPFEIGKGQVLWQGENSEVGIIVTGNLAHNALMAAKELEAELSVSILALHTLKPIDADAIVALAKECEAVVTVEEHQIAGGLGSAVAEVLVQHNPVPQEFIGVHDRFGQSGKPDELHKEYGLDVESIVAVVRKAFKRK